jgi:hypothetical protein
MDQISDSFAFGGRHRGSGQDSLPLVRVRQQGPEDFSYTEGFTFNLGMGGASDRGAPTRTIQWDLPGGTGSSGDEGPGVGGPIHLWQGERCRANRCYRLHTAGGDS